MNEGNKKQQKNEEKLLVLFNSSSKMLKQFSYFKEEKTIFVQDL